MKTLCIIPCGSRKIWNDNPEAGPTKAKYVYTGTFAKKCREYAEKFFPLSWCILSAKHGFLLADDIVSEPYNISFNKKRTNPITLDKLAIQARDKGLLSYNKIIVICGKNYANIIKKVFSGKEIVMPLDDCKGMGYMMEKLNNIIMQE